MISKGQLRKQILNKIDLLTADAISHQSQLVTNKVLQLKEFQEAQNVSIYLSMTKEIQTNDIIETLFAQNKKVFVPRFIFGGNEMEMLQITSFDELESNKWGIRQPMAKQNFKSVFDYDRLDLVLAPGLGFDLKGNRLGRGKGYYDRFLATCFNKFQEKPYLVGLGFSEQIVSDVPMGTNDVKMNLVLSP